MIMGTAGVSLVCSAGIVGSTGVIKGSDPASIYVGYVERLRIHLMGIAVRDGWVQECHGAQFGGLSRCEAQNALTRARMRGWVLDSTSWEEK